MNDRTAEIDTITPLAGSRTLLAGARVKATPRPEAASINLGYTALIGNLPISLARAGIAPQAADAESSRFLGDMPHISPERGRFVIATIDSGNPESVAKIAFWRSQVAAVGARGELIVASPNPSLSEYSAHDQLTPILMWQPAKSQSPPDLQLLYSPSTRAAGLIANTDLAATIASQADVELAGPSFGGVCTPQAAPSKIANADLLTTVSRDAAIQARRQQSVPFLAAALAALIAIASILVATKRYHGVGLAAVYAITPIPLILLYARTWQETVAVAAMIAVCETMAAAALKKPSIVEFKLPTMPQIIRRWTVPLICAVSLAAIALDTFFNHAHATAMSLLGYSPLEGARYYGLGNEAMGVIAGAVAVLSSLAFPAKPNGRFPRPVQVASGAALWLTTAALLALPELGAKAGSIPVMGVGLLTFLLLASKSTSTTPVANAEIQQPGKQSFSPRAWTIIAAAALAITALACVKLIHLHTPDTHVAISIEQAHRFGPRIYRQIALRKLSMDAHLVFHSVWMLVLTSAAVAVAGTLLNLRRIPRRPQADTRKIALGLATTLACLIFNDAGVVAAALCSCFIWGDLLTSGMRTVLKSAEINQSA